MEKIKVRKDGLIDIEGLTLNEVQFLKITVKRKHYTLDTSWDERRFDDDFVARAEKAQDVCVKLIN